MKARLALSLLLCLVLAAPALAAEKVTIYLFSSKTCINCLHEGEFLAALTKRIPQLEVRSFEVQFDPANAKLLTRVAAAFGVAARGVPMTFISTFEPITGFESDATTGRLIEARVRECLGGACEDVVGPLIDSGRTPPAGLGTAARSGPAGIGTRRDARDPGTVLALPLIGRTDFSTMPLLALTVILGALDSFNPCAFFVLFSLLGILVHARSRVRMLAVGGVFVLFSGIVYFVFMAAWLNVFLYVGQMQVITTAAGVVALCIAGINIKDYFLFKQGISLTIPEGRKPGLFARMRGLLRESSVPAMLFGTMVLALAANTYELLCTAGFPLVFTRILTLNHLRPVEYFLHLALYNVVYILPLATVVAVFSFTLGARKLSETQGRAMKLVSGLMMLGLGTVVLVNPVLFNNVLVGVGLLAFALLAAWAIVGLQRWRHAAGGVR
jgi:hypothetical protein